MSQEFQPLIPYFVNFSIVVAILVYWGRAPLRKFVYQRHERMRDAVESAARAHSKATARASAANSALAAVKTEEGAVLAREAANAEQEKKEIIEKAKAEAQRVAREAERLAGVEQEEASERVKGQFVDLVVRETEESLKRGLKKDDHSAIIKRAQNSIEVGV
ncbi:MAG: F0F1 ATP synthase subunit B family protein [Bdellovibrionota bacterium]